MKYYARAVTAADDTMEELRLDEVEGNMAPSHFLNFMSGTLPMITDTLLGKTVFVHAKNRADALRQIQSVAARYTARRVA